MTFITRRNQGFAWHHRGGLHVKGYFFDAAGRFYEKESLLDFFPPTLDRKGFLAKVTEADGCFAVVVENEDGVFAAVDGFRTMPLFYRASEDDISIADDLWALVHDPELRGSDPVAREFFLRGLATFGADTLHPDIKQLEAGTLLTFRKGERLEIVSYFNHLHGDYLDQPIESLVKEADEVLMHATERFIASTRGRTIALALSGGYDSRSILCALARCGHKDVVCYTYGRSDSFDLRTAQAVASRLGYPIQVVEYTEDKWRSLYRAGCFQEYCRFASNDASAPHCQDLPAMHEIRQNHLLPDDSMIATGHYADTLGGTAVPLEILIGRPDALDREGIAAYLMRTTMTELRQPLDPYLREKIFQRFHEYAKQFSVDDIASFCSVLEELRNRHRMAKYILNSVRVYEWHGFEWRLPLWNRRRSAWWNRIPLSMRINSRLYHKFLFERLFDPLGVGFSKPKSTAKLRLRALLRTTLPSGWIRAMDRIYYRLSPRAARREINAYDALNEFLLNDFPPGISVRVHDYGGIVGILASWHLRCNAHPARQQSSTPILPH